MITDVPGVLVGSWTDQIARTGCTVVLFPGRATASGEVMGGAPATREFSLLSPDRMAGHIDAVVLGGGSTFGLSACDGVVRWCEERRRGLETRAGVVPIVVGACIFDLTQGDPFVRPGPEDGYAACEAAKSGPLETGQVGAGTGATVGQWRGSDAASPGGLGTASLRLGSLVVGALVAVNSLGDVIGLTGSGDALADAESASWPDWQGSDRRGSGPQGPDQKGPDQHGPDQEGRQTSAGPAGGESTTVGVVATNAGLDKAGCFLVARSSLLGFARALEPVSTSFDGDAMVAASVGDTNDRVSAPLELVRMLAARATTEAIRAAVR